MNPYKILGVSENATTAEIKRAYKTRSKGCHPDVAGEEARPLFEQLTKARDILLSPEARLKFDKYGAFSEADLQKEKELEDRAIGKAIEVLRMFTEKTVQDQDFSLDFVKFCRDQLNGQKRRLRANLETNKEITKKLVKIIKKMTAKTDRAEILINVQKDTVRDLSRQREGFKLDVTTVDKAIELVEGVEYDFDKLLERRSFGSTASATNNFVTYSTIT